MEGISDMNIDNRSIITTGIGEVVWDVMSVSKHMGGAPANFVYFTQLLGAEGYVVSAVGADESGYEMLKQVDKIGLNKSFIFLDNKHPTGEVSINTDSDRRPQYNIFKKAAWDFLPITPKLLGLSARSDVIYYGTLAQRSKHSHENIRIFIESTQPECLRVFDINLRQRFYSEAIILELLYLSNVVKISDEELPLISKMCSFSGSESEVLNHLIDRFGLQLIALTKGKFGSKLVTVDDESFYRAEHVNVVSTLGAGAAFTAALVMGTLKGLPLDIINERANRLAAFVCTQESATPAVPMGMIEKLLDYEISKKESIQR